MKPTRLYTDLAALWPLLSPPEDYAPEAKLIRQILRRELGPATRTKPWSLLELGAGGGHTLYHLQDVADAVAVDLSPAMLGNCRRLCPGVETVVGDMRNVRLGREFDAVLLHDAVDYITTERDLRRTLKTVHAHLRRGGVALVAPTYTRETFADHEMEHDNRGAPSGVAYASYVHDPDPGDATFEMILVYLLRRRGRVHVVEDRHTCGLFPRKTWLALLREAGFRVRSRQGQSDRPFEMFVAIKGGGAEPTAVRSKRI